MELKQKCYELHGHTLVFTYNDEGVGKITLEGMDLLVDMAKNAPKRGEWLPDENGDFRCTNCGRIAEWEFFEDNFCPNCGADMREREGE